MAGAATGNDAADGNRHHCGSGELRVVRGATGLYYQYS